MSVHIPSSMSNIFRGDTLEWMVGKYAYDNDLLRCVSAELLTEVIVGLRVARQTIHRVKDYSICFEKVY